MAATSVLATLRVCIDCYLGSSRVQLLGRGPPYGSAVLAPHRTGRLWRGCLAGPISRRSGSRTGSRTAQAAFGGQGQAQHKVKEATAIEFELAIDGGGPVVVDFYAEWCGPCRMLSPIVEAVAEHHGEVNFLKVDTEVEEALASDFRIEGLPTLLFFKGGSMEPVYKHEGYLHRQNLEDLIKQLFPEVSATAAEF